MEWEDQILRDLRKLLRAADSYSRKVSAEFGLSGTQLRCLRKLGGQGPLATGELAQALSLKPATVCGILDRLEARKLVVRERRADDKRLVIVRLSEAGTHAAEQSPPSLQDCVRQRLRALPEQERVRLCRSLGQLVALMSSISHEDDFAQPATEKETGLS